MSALREVETEYDVARLQEREVHRRICLRAGMRLHVGVVGGEQLLHAVDRELLHHVHEFAPAVVPLPGESLRVLIGQWSSHCLEHRWRDEVLARDQLEPVTLPIDLEAYESGNLWI